MLGSLGMPEIAIILLVCVLIFGPKQLPKLGKGIGETIREFRKIGKDVSDVKDDVTATANQVVREVKRPL